MGQVDERTITTQRTRTPTLEGIYLKFFIVKFINRNPKCQKKQIHLTKSTHLPQPTLTRNLVNVFDKAKPKQRRNLLGSEKLYTLTGFPSTQFVKLWTKVNFGCVFGRTRWNVHTFSTQPAHQPTVLDNSCYAPAVYTNSCTHSPHSIGFLAEKFRWDGETSFRRYSFEICSNFILAVFSSSIKSRV